MKVFSTDLQTSRTVSLIIKSSFLFAAMSFSDLGQLQLLSVFWRQANVRNGDFLHISCFSQRQKQGLYFTEGRHRVYRLSRQTNPRGRHQSAESLQCLRRSGNGSGGELRGRTPWGSTRQARTSCWGRGEHLHSHHKSPSNILLQSILRNVKVTPSLSQVHILYVPDRLSCAPENSAPLLPFSPDCSKVVMCPTKMISQRNDAFYFEVHGVVCDLAEQSWTLNAELKNAVLRLKELKCFIISK